MLFFTFFINSDKERRRQFCTLKTKNKVACKVTGDEWTGEFGKGQLFSPISFPSPFFPSLEK